MRCPRCGAEADYGPFYRDFHPDDFYYVDYECTECGWEGDDAILAYSEDFGLDPFKDDVAEYFRGHDHGRRVVVDDHIAGEYADAVAVFLLEVAEFLITQGLDGRGIDNTLVGPQALFDGIFGNQGFTRTGGGGNQN